VSHTGILDSGRPKIESSDANVVVQKAGTRTGQKKGRHHKPGAGKVQKDFKASIAKKLGEQGKNPVKSVG